MYYHTFIHINHGYKPKKFSSSWYAELDNKNLNEIKEHIIKPFKNKEAIWFDGIFIEDYNYIEKVTVYSSAVTSSELLKIANDNRDKTNLSNESSMSSIYYLLNRLQEPQFKSFKLEIKDITRELIRESSNITAKKESDMIEIKDIFISHASEDKKEIVEPLVQVLEANGISCWYDTKDIGWGNSIVEKINNGLAKSNYFLVVVSDIFLSKNWAKTELNTLMDIEIYTGETKVLPLIVGDANKIHNQFKKDYPLLHPKLYLEWNNNPENIAKELKKILGKSKDIQDAPTNFSNTSVIMPKIRKKITQYEKDEFINDIYKGIVEYFEKALKHLEEYDKSIKTTMIKVNELKFIATVYLDGERASQCKIWMGGVFGSTSISYAIGDSYIDINNDNSCNDWLSLEENEEGLYMKSSGMMHLLHNHDKKIRNPKEAGEYFWKSFIEPLER